MLFIDFLHFLCHRVFYGIAACCCLLICASASLLAAANSKSKSQSQPNVNSNANVTHLSFSGRPSPLVINRTVAGNAPLAVSESSTSYHIINSQAGAKIIGSLNANMPSNTTLKILITAPSGATRPGPIVLSTTPQDLTTNIPPCSYQGLPVTYTFSATLKAGVVPPTQRTVTITLIN